jgi:hypothetical protein
MWKKIAVGLTICTTVRASQQMKKLNKKLLQCKPELVLIMYSEHCYNDGWRQ